MTEQEFEYVRKLVLDHTANVLDSSKGYLVESRLGPMVRHLKLGSISELVSQLRGTGFNALHRQVVEAMVTTETLFFRDHHPFENLRRVVLPELIQRRAREGGLRIWSAACSTGQEVYSLALLIREHFPELARWDLKLLASDVSQDVLNRAREGRYNQIEINLGLPAPLLLKYFQQDGTHWQLNTDVRRMVEFWQMNLTQPWPPLPRLDLVLLRNVMIYMDVAAKKTIFARVAQLLRPDGYLILGGAETPFNIDSSFRRVEHLKSGFYQLAPTS